MDRLFKKLAKKIEEFFGLDLRSLALLRIATGTLILFDLASRASDLTAHYTDIGVLPRPALFRLISPWSISVHFASGSWQIQALLFAIAALFAIFLIVGYKTKLATIVSWFLLLSLQNRNYMILSGADQVFKVLLFWAMFLPWGAKYSIDSLKGSDQHLPKQILTVGTFAYTMQVVFIYLFAVLHKTGAEWRTEGTAVYYALSLGTFALPPAFLMLKLPMTALKVLSFSVFWFEALGSLFLFIPKYTGLIRTLVVFAFVFMHLSFGINMKLGIFSWVSSIIWLGLLPSWFWDNIAEKLLKKLRIHLTIYYDYDCGFCQKATRLLNMFFLFGQAKILSAYENKSVQKEMEKENSWVIVSNKGKHFRFDAFLAIAKHSPILWIFLPVFFLLKKIGLGDFFYKAISTHRKEFCPLPANGNGNVPKLTLSPFVSILACLFLLYIFFQNLSTVKNTAFAMPKKLNFVGAFFRIDQRWNMFAPYPKRQDGWYIMPATLANGKIVDVFTDGKPITYAEPVLIADTYKNARWQKYFSNLLDNKNRLHRMYYAAYICRRWNATHTKEEKIKELKINYISMYVTLMGKTPPTEVSLLTYKCP